jgi:hypothetical protein
VKEGSQSGVIEFRSSMRLVENVSSDPSSPAIEAFHKGERDLATLARR